MTRTLGLMPRPFVDDGRRGADEPLGCRIRRLRLERGWSIRELSRRSGHSLGPLSKAENDEVRPSLDAFAAIAAALGVTMDELYRGTP